MKIGRFLRSVLLIAAFIISGVTRADYASVNGINMYYEVKGSGTPLVFLHGGYDDSEMWNLHTAFLSSKYKIIKIDSRGHGRSELGDLPLTYEQMASDTLELLEQLNISNAHFVGWSDGGVIASHIAAAYPEKVNQLILFGAAFQGSAYTNVFNALFFQPNLFLGAMDLLYKNRYEGLNPFPELWTPFSSDLYLLWLTPCYFSAQPADNCFEPLQSISAPTLVVAGDLEFIKRSHTETIADNIPGAELKIVPFAGHYLPKLRPFLATSIINNFLNN